MTSRADQHDIDKLGRWLNDLVESSNGGFPVYAVFLVSEADRTAHDIFRAFRTSFEQRHAGFANLVIFGQHGVSSTVHALLARLCLPSNAIPLLLLLTSPVDSLVYLLHLPSGGESGLNADRLPQAPLELLSGVEQFVGGANDALDELDLTELTEMPFPEADLLTLVRQLSGELLGP